MPNFKQLLLLTSLAIAASAAVTPALRLRDAPTTDFDSIFSTIRQVQQKTGAEDNAPPSDIVPPTVVTAADGIVTSAGSSGAALLAALHSGDSLITRRQAEVPDINPVPQSNSSTTPTVSPNGQESSDPEVTVAPDVDSIVSTVVATTPVSEATSVAEAISSIVSALVPEASAPVADPDALAWSTPGYELVFGGTGLKALDRDGSIQGTAYLTFTVLPGETYDIDGCLQFCSRVQGCVFANLYYEYNNHMTATGVPPSELKCAVYGDIHSTAEKTNRGGQQQLPAPYGLTYIQQSGGFAARSLADPADPVGFEEVFGPEAGAANAPGYMGFSLLDKYDVDACAKECRNRGADPVGGPCRFFNIWRALVNGNPTSYSCSMYYIVSDDSTATNYGQGDLKVTYSRAYRRLGF